VSEAIPVAFYAPLKEPNHPSPSGDRTMARLLMKALQAGGFAPILASTLRTLDRAGDRALQARLRTQSAAEADRLIAAYHAAPEARRPRAWFTYHVYYKAPDWIGPGVAETLGIPYVVAEGSRAGKRANGPWAMGHAGAEAALDRAEAIFVMTEADREALQAAKPAGQMLIDLPPFLDVEEWDGTAPVSARQDSEGTLRFLTVAMIRPGDKLASYAILADALTRLGRHGWTLDIAGDGEARSEVGRLFAPFGERVRFRGLVEDRASLAALYAEADLFLWPAVNEAYGMALLEAQAFGCPVIAGAYGGVRSVVRNDVTGLLTVPGDAAAFAAAVGALIDDPGRRRALGNAARRSVTEERGLRQAAARLRSALIPLVAAEARS
jgi:glycosyltransferase involved in cell wall biosynthesis